MTFSETGLNKNIQKAIADLGFKTPTPIQQEAIPYLLENETGLIALAQTGTGKTAAFSLPILHHLENESQNQGKRKVKALIVTPTRELAIQIGDNFTDYSKYNTIKNTVIFGGVKQGAQVSKLRRGVDILVATPGRLEDLVDQKGLRLDETKFLVLDEADQMLDIGFLPAVKRIISKVNKDRQTLLFSATMSKEIKKLTETYLTDPVQVSVTPENSTVDKIEQSLMHLSKQNKGLALQRIISANPKKRVIVFSRTKHGSDKLVKWLGTQNIGADAIHGNKSQAARTNTLKQFKLGKVRALVATDIAARGIDINALPYVINYELPYLPEDYIHRIGRTGRARTEGEAFTLCKPEELPLVTSIEKLLGNSLPRKFVDDFSYRDSPEEMAPTGAVVSKKRNRSFGKQVSFGSRRRR